MSHIPLEQLTIYQLSKKYGKEHWAIYQSLDWQIKKILGDQSIRSADSVGANIAEGYGRFHYLDKIRFYYNARGSLFESKHWLDLFYERQIIDKEKYFDLIDLYREIARGLNGLINANYRSKNGLDPDS